MSGKYIACVALLLAITAGPVTGQAWDTSGNGQLKGAYYFREVAWLVGDNTGTIGDALAIYGIINFDGNGNYSLSNAQLLQVNSNSSTGYSVSGYNTPSNPTYSISASGYGFINNLVIASDVVYGLVTKGIFIASSTDNSTSYNDLFIAAPLASPAPTTPFFKGSYAMADVDFSGVGIPNGVLATRASSFTLTPDGTGNLGAFTATGHIAGSGTTGVSQSFSRLSYSFSGGAGVINFGSSLGASSGLIAQTKYLYFSPDGNFVFGGSPTAWDMIIGLRTGTATPPFSGLYYQAGVEQDDSTLNSGYAATNSHFGSIRSLSGTLLGHRRVLSIFNKNAFDYTHTDTITANANGTYDDPYDHYTFTADGSMAVGSGTGSFLGINVLLQAPQFTPSGVYINPTGVVNAGSSAPFTASFAPGELVSIYGNNLASTTTVDSTLPTMLGGVQVMVNGRAAPIYSVAHTPDYDQINAIIPLATVEGIASVQVIENGAPSNIVTNFMGSTAPGIFNSLATPAVQHSNYTLVTPLQPVQPGETLLVYLTGLGALDANGNATSQITAYVGGMQASVLFAGSQLPVAGGYQLNVTVPTGLSAGNAYLDISGPDAYTSEAVIPIGSGAAAAIRPQIAHRPIGIRNVPRSRRP